MSVTEKSEPAMTEEKLSVHGIDNDDTQNAPPPLATASKSPSFAIWLSLGGLVIVALAVIFVLPTLVTEYQLPLERRIPSPDVVSAGAFSSAATVAISPFEQAQQALQRKEAQDVLAQLLQRQSQLTEMEVDQWAAQPYEAALELARLGDEHYREQRFGDAKSAYEQSTVELQDIIDSIPLRLSELLVEGKEAIAESDATLALEKYSQALMMDTQNAEALAGQQVAESLDDVTQLLRSAATLREEGDLDGAKSLYEQAIGLDPSHQQTQALLDQTNRDIRQRQFAGIMSEGFRNLGDDNPEAAISAFNRALAMGINSDQAQAAITQAETEIADAKILVLREQVSSAEAAEQWEAAVGLYGDILAIDANLVFALTGQDHTQKRLRLDQLLENSINNPFRISDPTVYQQVQDIYYTGESIADPGEKLSGQLAQLKPLLESSQIVEDIEIISDNLTDITLLRVGQLGAFESQSVTLKPGEYVLLGKRNGYREVREEFTVGFGNTTGPVTVICNERVVASGR